MADIPKILEGASDWLGRAGEVYRDITGSTGTPSVLGQDGADKTASTTLFNVGTPGVERAAADVKKAVIVLIAVVVGVLVVVGIYAAVKKNKKRA